MRGASRYLRRAWPLALAGLAVLGLGARGSAPDALAPADLDAYYRAPLPVPEAALSVYHLGHSLVGRDMPLVLQNLAPEGHFFHSQLGWGASLKQHWDGDVPGFAEENAHPAHRPVEEALDSGAYDAVVLTEMVEIRDAIAYHDSGAQLGRWAKRARAANPNARLYLYETWHRLDTEEGWLNRLDSDLEAAWEGRLLAEAMASLEHPIYVVPAGQVMAAFVRKIEATGTGTRDMLFRDPIHLSAAGAYLVALTHFAVLYHQSPVGLPVPEADVTPDLALTMQEIVWRVVTTYPKTGVAQK